MFYSIQDNYRLNGWEKLPCVLVRLSDNHIQFLEQDQFRLLLLCDGHTDFDQMTLSESDLRLLERLEAKGIIACHAEGRPAPLPVYRYYHNRHASSIFWSVTGRCNYRCRHCYMDAPDAAMGQLSTEQALSLIDEMAECGILRIDITGGEPFVRKDFWQLMDRLASYGIRVGKVYTNGWLLNGAVLDEFEKRGMHPAFSISFDGVGWHDWMRGVKGAEEAALRAFRLCRDRGYVTDVEMCIHRGNIDSIRETIRTLEEAGVTAIKICSISQTELWKRNSCGLDITETEYTEAMIQYIPEYYKSGSKMAVTLSGIIELFPYIPGYTDNFNLYKIVAEKYDGTENCLNDYLCEALRNAIYITPDGRLLPCMPMTSAPKEDQEKFPLISEIGLQKGLSDSFFMKYVDSHVRDLLAANAECNACPHRYKCGGGCRAMALLEGDHDLMGPDRTQCMLWNEGYVERIRQTAEEAIAKYCRTDC